MGKKRSLVVIGNGMAGARLVEEIIKRDSSAFEITVFGAEPRGNYNRILLSEVLSGTRRPGDIFLNPLSWYAENGVTLHAGVKVLRLDRERRVVVGAKVPPGTEPYGAGETVGGEIIEVSYDTAVIATGSRPFLPPIENFAGEGAFLFRTLDEAERIGAYAGSCGKAVVIGGGLLGLEAARGLSARGLRVTVIEAADRLMPAQLDAEAGRILQATLTAMGIEVFCGKTTRKILRHGGRIRNLVLDDGYELATDMVVVGAGIRPVTEIASASGLDVGRGILCDDRLRTSDPAVFAVGECVEHRGRIYGLLEPVWEQARVLADFLTEKNPDALYNGSKMACTKLKVMGVDLVSMGETEAGPEDEVIRYVEPSRGVLKKMIIRENRIKGAVLLGETETAGVLTQFFLMGTSVPKRRADLLFGTATGVPVMNVFDLPDHAQICNCGGVSKGELKEAIQIGKCRSVSQVVSCTRAGSGCGSCKKIIAQFLEAYAGEVAEDPAESRYVPGIAMTKPELIAAVRQRGLKSVSAIFRGLAGGREVAEAKPALASLLRTVWHAEYGDERDARFINDRVGANIQKDGAFSVVPRMYGGVTTADELLRIGGVAKKYAVPRVKLTGGQRIDLLGVRKEDLQNIWKDLGLPSGHAYTKAVRTVKSCVGTDFCRFGLGDAIGFAQKIERLFQGVETPHKVKMAVAGCPRNCSETYVKDVGIVAVEGGRWEVYVGGAAGSSVRKGDLLLTVSNPDDVILHVGRFLQYYRENARYGERTYGFVERVGIMELKSVLLDDSLGICGALDGEMQKAIKAYRDPWSVVLGPVATIPPGEGRCFVVSTDEVAVFRARSGALYALGNRCPHKGGPLCDGLTDETFVICPCHGHKFDLRTGEGSVAGERAGTFAVREKGGEVQLIQDSRDIRPAESRLNEQDLPFEKHFK